MAKILSIDSFDGTVLVNLIDGAENCVFVGESGTRPLRSKGGLITRTFTFRMTASTKALARVAVNTFINSLNLAIKWNENNLESNSIFLREAADGETAVRSLIMDFDASAAVDGSAIDAYQTMNTVLHVNVAITVQDLREEASTTSPGYTSIDNPGAIGRLYNAYSSNNTSPSRMLLTLNSTITEANKLERFWVGMAQYRGADFQHIWSFDYTAFGADTTTATVSGSYSTLVTDTNFTDSLMETRAVLTVDSIYGAGGYDDSHARGEFVALLRYKTSAAGTYLVRGGITYYDAVDAAYNETRVLDDSTEWRFMSLGVFKFPPNGAREETSTAFAYSNLALIFDAQRLSGSGHLYMDSITLIPYDHFIHVDKMKISTTGRGSVVTHEDKTIEAFSGSSFSTGYGAIQESKNWMFPKIDGTYVTIVVAAERGDSQGDSDNISLFDLDIYKAYEAYHV